MTAKAEPQNTGSHSNPSSKRWLGITILLLLFATVGVIKWFAGPQREGFTFIAEESYSCAGQSFKVKVYRHELFARALGVSADERDPACEFVLIPPGQYSMGSKKGRKNETPAHTVKIEKAFLLARTELSQSVYKAVMAKSPAAKKGNRLPVNQVSWFEAMDFCKQTKLRLPTEAEWEYAARAGSESQYYWGDAMDPEHCWHDENAFKQASEKKGPQDVSAHARANKVNAFGLADMLGNVWEWCQDDYFDNYSGNKPSNQKARQKKKSGFHVYRGGSWSYSAKNCRSSARDGDGANYRANVLGFRVAADIEALPVKTDEN
ncbi:MAG: SUMF1/EgtB/PvdO family nonheme iron enzyme [Planctomycetota bacterium]|nr:SUMF1/EgtB/PvdO family nonheme iron enzyme [Planctomycetota bacterium]